MSETDIQTILGQAQPSAAHDWLLTTGQVAEGYGVDTSTLRGHKANKPEALREGHHWIKDGKTTYWTKAGVVQLGFCVQSSRGNAFREMAEKLVLAGMSTQPTEPLGLLREETPSDLDEIAQSVARKVLPVIQQGLLEQRIRHHISAGLLTNLEAVGDSLGKSIGAIYGLDLSVEISQAIASYRSEVRV